MKPYTAEEVRKQLEKAARFREMPKKRVAIQTMPDFSVRVDGELLTMNRKKTEELLALLVDRGNAGVTAGEAIACLWPDRAADVNTGTLYRMTCKRLLDVLKEKGIDDILVSQGRKKYLRTDLVDCDLYRLLDGDQEVLRNFSGEYLRAYSWAEFTNARLNSLKTDLY